MFVSLDLEKADEGNSAHQVGIVDLNHKIIDFGLELSFVQVTHLINEGASD